MTAANPLASLTPLVAIATLMTARAPAAAHAAARDDATQSTCNADAEQTLSIDSPVARDWFGWAVAVHGDTLAVGAPQRDGIGADSGTVYVYRHDGRRWRLAQVVTPSDAEARDGFGIRIALDGPPGEPAETMLIGSHVDGEAGGFAGAAYLFTFDDGVWIERQKLVAPQRDSFDQFGYAVAVHGDTAVIGAIGDDDAGRDAGAAYVFNSDGETWTLMQKLTAGDGADWERFGADVSLDGDVALIGAFRDENTGQFDPGLGAAYVFRRTNGVWTEEAKLTAPQRELDDRFGWSVAIDGATAAVGAYYRDDAARDAGSIFLYNFADDRWTHTTTLHREDAAAGDGFGLDVVLDGNVLLAGAPYAAVNGTPNVGLVTMYRRQFDAWVERGTLASTAAAGGDSLGAGVAWDDGATAVGAYLADVEGIADAGALYTFDTDRCLPPCTGDELIRKARCRETEGRNRLRISLRGGASSDDYAIDVAELPTSFGTLNRRGRARIRIDNVPPGGGDVIARWGCGAERVAAFECP